MCLVAAALVAGSACSSKPDPATAATPGSAASTPQAPGAMPAAMPPMAAQGAAETITGEVVETMDASSYTYLRVRSANGDVWVATSKTKVAVGEKVVAPLEQAMENFHSASLNRDFPLIYFVTAIRREGQPTAPPMAVGHGMGSGAAPKAAVKVEPVAPPAGGSSIADVWANRAKLVGKTVAVRGTVVKFNGGIMGRNWIHLQDGSGSAADGTNDLTVTTDAVVNAGDVITVTGTVAVDRDFGFGYAYALLLEKARIK